MELTVNPTGDLSGGGIWMLSTEKRYNLPFEVWRYRSPYEEAELPTTVPGPSLPNRMEWLAREVFKALIIRTGNDSSKRKI
jgi:hypothetical protein